MKTILKIITGLALCLQSAFGYDTITTILTGGTNNISAASTNSTLDVRMTATRSPYLTPQVTFALNGAGTTAVVFKFDESVDGANWAPSTFTISVTPAGATSVSGLTRQTVGASGYFRLRIVENPNASAVTNLLLRYSTKP